MKTKKQVIEKLEFELNMIISTQFSDDANVHYGADYFEEFLESLKKDLEELEEPKGEKSKFILINDYLCRKKDIISATIFTGEKEFVITVFYENSQQMISFDTGEKMLESFDYLIKELG